MTVRVDTRGHAAEAYTKTYNLSPAETAALVNEATAAASRAYKLDDINSYAAYRGLVGIVTPTPTVTTLTPNTKVTPTAEFNVVVAGTNFQPWSVVIWNGAPRPTTYTSATSLTVNAPIVRNAGVVPVYVSSGGPVSNSVNFTFT